MLKERRERQQHIGDVAPKGQSPTPEKKALEAEKPAKRGRQPR